jgi:hypothetical protein
MLGDRACPEGGWNAGNGIVFGAALKPHIDATAIALLALSDPIQSAVRGLNWLRQACLNCSSAYSLAWSAIAFLMYRDSIINHCVRNLLRALPAKPAGASVEVLSLTVIALNAVEGTANPFQVTK